MTRRPRLNRFLLVLLPLLILAGAARADLDLPGLDADSNAYQQLLEGRTPAGGTPQQRRTAEARAADSARRNDWAGVVAALEARVGMGEAVAGQWLALARAQLRKTPPDPARALQAGWQAYSMADSGQPEIPALLVMADALRAQDRNAQAIQVYEAVLERDPANPTYRQMLADARRAVGLLVSRVRTEPEADPPRACIAFAGTPSRAPDFHPGDWVRLDPPLPDAAVTREGDQICVSGLKLGATTRVLLRAGLPGEDGIALNKPATLAVAMGNRQPRLILESRSFLLPRGQAPRVTLASVNLSAVKLRLLRLTERTILPFTRENRLGEAMDYLPSALEDNARVVWEGAADIPSFQANALIRTALPLPDVMGEPGLYVLVVRPGDGQPASRAFAAQPVLRTDLAPTVWRGSDGLTVQVRGFSDAKPRAGARLRLMARSNDILAEAETDADGVARFAAPLLKGEGPSAPAAVHGFLGDDFVALDLNAAAFDLSDRGVEGRKNPGPLDAFVYLDRGIYRPGETVQVMALLRDGAGRPVDLPARLRVKRPNGEVFQEAVPPRLGDAAVHWPVTLSAGAAAGTWTVEVLADPKDPPIGSAEFRVDAFVPDRMAVDLGPAPGPIVPGSRYELPVAARFLYGAPGANLTGKGNIRLEVDPDPPAALTGYRIGLDGEEFAPDAKSVDLPGTDAQGRTTLPIDLPRAPDSTRPVRAAVDVEIDDPAGRASRAATTIPVRGTTRLIGIRPLFDGGSVDAGGEAAFEVAAVDPDGKRVAVPAKLRLVRERADWRMVTSGQVAHFETVWRDEPLQTADIAIPADGTYRFARRLDFGRYRLEIAEAGGLAATSVRFRAGWVGSDNPDVPDKVDVSAGRRLYAPGESARIHVAPPFDGQATVLVLTDRVQGLRDVEVKAGGTDIDIPVDAAWGPGAYVAVHAFRPGGDAQRPNRAIGLAWVGIDPASRRLDVAIGTPDKLPPRARATVPVRTAPGAWVTLAAVDEGVLRLTSFATPDPVAHFFGRRMLGLDIRDDWGRLIAPAEGGATVLRQGGDEGGAGIREIPQKVVALFTPPVQAGPDGQVAIPVDLPDFAGQVRLMAVAWSGDKVGAAATDVLVRDPLVAEALLPRFLAPGDEAQLAVLMQNVELPAGEAVATVSVDGPLQLSGGARLAATLAPGQQALPATILRATGAGRGTVRLDVAGPGGFRVQREAAITVRPARPQSSVVAATEMAPGAEGVITPPTDRFIPGTWRATARFGGAVRYDPGALMRSLDAYPILCLEQATSKGLPLALLPEGPVAGADRMARLQRMVASVLDRQRYDGGFALWTANGEAEPWLSSYATEFLLRAKAAGAAVPDAALKDALKFAADALDESGSEPKDLAAQAYRLHVLALAGQPRAGAARVLAESLDKLPTPLARAQLGAALARANDAPRAEAAFAASLSAPARKFWYEDYGSALRDQVAVALLLKESGLLPDRLPRLLSQLPGADLTPEALNTQEEAWAAALAGALGRDGQPARVALDGAVQPPAPVVSVALDGPATARNAGDRPLWQTVSVTGVPRDAPPAARAGMRVTRRFFNLDGSPLNLDGLRQNAVFVLLLEGRADDGQDHRALLTQGLPAGWEIAGRMSAGEVPGMKWLAELSETEAQPAADDRYAAVIKLAADKPDFRVAVRLRAVTPGNFEMPGAELADMYRPGIFARQGANRVVVQPNG